MLKSCCLYMEYQEDQPKFTPYKLPTRKSPLKGNHLKDYEMMNSLEKNNLLGKNYSDSKVLTSADLNISHLKNTCKDRKKIKDAVMVRKIDLKQKEYIELKKIPAISPAHNMSAILNQTVDERRVSLFDLHKKHNSISPHPFLRRNCTDGNLIYHAKTAFKSFAKQIKTPPTALKLENLQKKESQPSEKEKLEKMNPFQPITKADTVMNARLMMYLSFIKDLRRDYNFSEDCGLPLLAKKRSLRVKIKRGNNSLLIKQLFKKRWWWTIDDDKDSKIRSNFIWSQLKDKTFFQENNQMQEVFSHNHFNQNEYLGNKKALFYNMSHYYSKKELNVFDYLPLTFHVHDVNDEAWKKFTKKFKENQEKKQNNIWILKPGQNSNRGKGITVHSCYHEIEQVIREGDTFTDTSDNSIKKRTFIIQAYIDKPFLYNKRKFDFRCYMLLVNINNTLRGYWYKDGYIRTSSFEFQLMNFNTFVHLTNDAIQNNSESYGKYEEGNKVSYPQFQKYLDTKHGECGYNIETGILPKMKDVALDSIRATEHILRGNVNKPVFQLFGLDFMIDESFNPWLIEINTNPCIETSSLVLEKIVPKLLDDTFKLSLDVLFPPPEYWPSSRRHSIPSSGTNFELIYEEKVDRNEHKVLQDIPSLGVITEDEEVYEEK